MVQRWLHVHGIGVIAHDTVFVVGSIGPRLRQRVFDLLRCLPLVKAFTECVRHPPRLIGLPSFQRFHGRRTASAGCSGDAGQKALSCIAKCIGGGEFRLSFSRGLLDTCRDFVR